MSLFFESWRPLKFEHPKFKVIQMKNRPFFNEKLGIIFFRTKYKSSFQCPIILFYQNIFLVPLPHHLLKKKKKDCLFFKLLFIFSKLYICLLESCGATTWKLWAALSNTIRAWFNTWFKICDAVIKGNFRNIFDLGNYSHEL